MGQTLKSKHRSNFFSCHFGQFFIYDLCYADLCYCVHAKTKFLELDLMGATFPGQVQEKQSNFEIVKDRNNT